MKSGKRVTVEQEVRIQQIEVFVHIVDGRNLHQLICSLSVYPIIYKVLYIPGGCLGFLPSTVSGVNDYVCTFQMTQIWDAGNVGMDFTWGPKNFTLPRFDSWKLKTNHMSQFKN